MIPLVENSRRIGTVVSTRKEGDRVVATMVIENPAAYERLRLGQMHEISPIYGEPERDWKNLSYWLCGFLMGLTVGLLI